MERRTLLSAGAAASAGAVGFVPPSVRAWTKPSDTGSIVPDLPVVDQEGRSYRFYTDLIQSRVVTLNFFFVGCGAICPLVTQNLRRVQDLLGSRVGTDIFMYSLTLRPEEDSPEVLKSYTRAYEIGPGWRFLTGAPRDVERLRKRLGFASAHDKAFQACSGVELFSPRTVRKRPPEGG